MVNIIVEFYNRDIYMYSIIADPDYPFILYVLLIFQRPPLPLNCDNLERLH